MNLVFDFLVLGFLVYWFLIYISSQEGFPTCAYLYLSILLPTIVLDRSICVIGHVKCLKFESLNQMEKNSLVH